LKLTVGILSSESGWEILLDQIGVDWKPVSVRDEVRPEDFSAIIVNTVPTSPQALSLRKYVEAGGAVLGVSGCAQQLVNSTQQKKYFSSLAPNQFKGFAQSEMLDLYSDGILETDLPHDESPFPAIHHNGRGIVACIPFDVNALILDTRTRRKNFYFHKNRLPSETVSTVSKGNLRRLITEVLQFLHLQREIPFVHKWYYPRQEQTVFTFRVDSDRGSEEEVNQLHALCKTHSIRTMWFLDTKSHERWLGRFKDFAEQEIGIHCYEHVAYSSYEANQKNLSRAALLLEKSRIRAVGASAPYGTWNPGIAHVFEQLGASFSSEFGLDYDNLPFFPIVEKGFSPVLQLPIHPICIGSMNRAGYAEGEMKEYFHRIIDKNILEREPICFYHHPTHRRWDVIDDVFQHLRSRNIPNMSYSDYAGWWRKRNAHKARLDYDPITRLIHTDDAVNDSDVYWRIAFPNGDESITPLRKLLQLDSLQRRHPDAPPLPPQDISRVRQFDFRHIIMNVLDAWHKRRQ
jgi:hypothetical protein